MKVLAQPVSAYKNNLSQLVASRHAPSHLLLHDFAASFEAYDSTLLRPLGEGGHAARVLSQHLGEGLRGGGVVIESASDGVAPDLDLDALAAEEGVVEDTIGREEWGDELELLLRKFR